MSEQQWGVEDVRNFVKDHPEMTISDAIGCMINIGSDKEAAKALFDSMVEQASKINDYNKEKAEHIVASNLGYMMGYAPGAVDASVWEELGCVHPIFGSLVAKEKRDNEFSIDKEIEGILAIEDVIEGSLTRAIEHGRQLERDLTRTVMLELADAWQHSPDEGGGNSWAVLNGCANDLREAVDSIPERSKCTQGEEHGES